MGSEGEHVKSKCLGRDCGVGRKRVYGVRGSESVIVCVVGDESVCVYGY